MRKMDRVAIKQVLKKRQIKSMNNSVHENTQSQPTLIATNKQITFEHILQKINKNDSKYLHKCQLNLQQKYALIELISQKQNISYNRNTLAALMTIWKSPTVCYFDNSKSPINDPYLQNLLGPKGIENFFLLQGHIEIFQKSQVQKPQQKKQQEEQEYYPTFETQSKSKSLSVLLQKHLPKLVIKQLFGWGSMFKRKQEYYQCEKEQQKSDNLQPDDIIFKIQPSIFVEFKAPELEGMLVNLGGMDQDKKYKIIQQFPVFSGISKKILNILPYIELKRYTKNQYIYKMKQNPHSIYLIIRGQVIFQVKVQTPKPKKNTNSNKNLPNDIILQTQALGLGNYFGEEEIIFKTTRNVNAICHSAQCDLLQIPIDKFDRLLTYSDFYQELKAAADFKINKRKTKIQKALQIFLQFTKNSQNNMEQPEVEERKTSTLDNKKLSIKKKPEEPVKIMHGNIIRKIYHNPILNETINFSMLGANPDMYEATLKKFRKYTMKPVEKYKPNVNWNLKRVWKVLNLQSILREETQVASPEGRKFFQSHRRLQNHVQQVKSLRPKTSSSTYRTKLQYIAYLQQFNS